jgi:hypothetical protein
MLASWMDQDLRLSLVATEQTLDKAKTVEHTA